MLAISIRQPWAWLIVHGYKSIENRSWQSQPRGRIWIHTGLRLDRGGMRLGVGTFPGDCVAERVPIGRHNRFGGA